MAIDEESPEYKLALAEDKAMRARWATEDVQKDLHQAHEHLSAIAEALGLTRDSSPDVIMRAASTMKARLFLAMGALDDVNNVFALFPSGKLVMDDPELVKNALRNVETIIDASSKVN